MSMDPRWKKRLAPRPVEDIAAGAGETPTLTGEPLPPLEPSGPMRMEDPRWQHARQSGLVGATPDMIVDIETIEDPDCPPPPLKPDAKNNEFGLAHWKIVTIGCAWLVNNQTRKIAVVQGDTEEEKLRSFVKIFQREPGDDTNFPRIVGWASRRFDLPVIAHRCLRFGIPWPWYYDDQRGRNPRYRYGFERHLDLMDFLCDHGASRQSSLDSCARLMGLPGKLGVSGGDVASLAAGGFYRQIDDYCLQDVTQTTALHLRVALLRGVLTLPQYQTAIASWREVVERTPGAADVLADVHGVQPAGLDIGRVMLGGVDYHGYHG